MESKLELKNSSIEHDITKTGLDESFNDLLSELESDVFLSGALDAEPLNSKPVRPSNHVKAPSKQSSGRSDVSVVDYQGPGQVAEMDGGALRPEQAEALLTISGLLNSDLNPGRVLRDMLKPIRALFHASRAAVFLRQNLSVSSLEKGRSGSVKSSEIKIEAENEGEIGPIVCAAALGLSQEYINRIISFYETKEFSRLQSLRQPVYVSDAQHDHSLNGVRELNQREGFLTMLTLPLLHRQMLIGLLVLYHDDQRRYSPEEIKLLSIFANQASLAITNARLYHESRRREREAALLAEASRFFNSSLKSREVLNQVVRAAAAILGNTALVFIVREGSDQAYPVAFYCRAALPSGVEIPSPVRSQPPIRLGEGAVGKTAQSGMPFFIRNPKDVLKAAPFIKSEYNVQSLLCVPLKTRGRAIGTLVSYQITSAEGKAERGVSQRQIGLAQALADRAAVAIENARLYEAEKYAQQAKDEFLSFVAHELRTPLTSIKGYNHLLSKRLQKPTAQFETNPSEYLRGLKHYTDVMDTQSERLHNLIQDLSSIALIESGKLELHPHPINLVDLASEMIEMLKAELAETRQTRPEHEISLRSNQPQIEIPLDPEATTRILRNLISNAIKFSPKGGNVVVRLTQTSSEVILSVQDNGIGIRPQDQEHIFERFYKASSQQARANGLGLGLYITKNLVEAQNGQIEVKSGEGNGSTFSITFPFSPK